LAEQTDIRQRFNQERNKIVDQTTSREEMDKEKAEVEKEYAQKDREAFQEAREKFRSRPGSSNESWVGSKEELDYQEEKRKRDADKKKELDDIDRIVVDKDGNPLRNQEGRFFRTQAVTREQLGEIDTKYQELDRKARGKAEEKFEKRTGNNEERDRKIQEVWNDKKLTHAQALQRVNEIKEEYGNSFYNSPEYKDYLAGKKKRDESAKAERSELQNQKQQGRLSDVQARSVDHQESVKLAESAMKHQERRQAVGAALQLPVRSSLEEAHSMINDELIRQGEAKRLAGEHSELAKSIEDSLKPSFEQLNQHYDKLERVLHSGQVKVVITGTEIR